MLTNKKTYIAGVGLVCFGIYQMTEGQFDAGLKSILEGAAIIALRLGIAKAGK